MRHVARWPHPYKGFRVHPFRLGLNAAVHSAIMVIRRNRPWTSLGTRIAVFGPDDTVLLIRHSYTPGWHFPGGGVGRWETTAAAAARELHEEAGLRAEGPPRLFGFYANFATGMSDHVALYVADRWSGVPRPDRKEIVEAGFFALSALPPDTNAGTRRRIAEIRGGAAVDPHW
jgi:8-oxo-dGTP pyrophosphatase MutT (NUDIX family)